MMIDLVQNKNDNAPAFQLILYRTIKEKKRTAAQNKKLMLETFALLQQSCKIVNYLELLSDNGHRDKYH